MASIASPNPVRQLLGKLRRLPARLRRPVDPHLFDLRDRSKLNAFLESRDCHPLVADPAMAAADLAGAMRYILANLKQVPNALSAGIDGAFAQSLMGQRGISTDAKAFIREAFESDPSARVRRIFEFREDLRGAFPLGLTPKGRGEYLEWIITYGVTDFKILPEAALWFHYELDEDPSRGLVASYRLHPEWQAAHPLGLTRFGWNDFKAWVGTRYGFTSRWLTKAVLPPQDRPWDELRQLLRVREGLRSRQPTNSSDLVAWAKSEPEIRRHADANWYRGLAQDLQENLPEQLGVNVIGLFRYTSGLQQAVKSTVESLSRSGVRTGLRDFPVLFLREPRNKQHFDALELHDVTIVNTGIDLSIAEAYRKAGLHPRAGVHRVAIWWWEMEEIPAKWHDRADGVDEIWAPTRFIADAMRRTFDKPVTTMNPGIELSPFEPLGKTYFGLEPSKYSFGFVFDMNSRMQRKNPLGLIEAFRRAFRPSDPVELVVKVSPPESYYKDQWRILHEAIAATPNVRLLDRVLTRPELLALIEATDCSVSLHRSEGFGLTCAEAMLLGKPVIATNYSGNLDFMNADNSYLVDYSKISIAEDIDPYPRGAVWADPSVEHAAVLMRRVFENRDEARLKGARAKADMASNFSLVAAGERMRARLAEIARLRGR